MGLSKKEERRILKELFKYGEENGYSDHNGYEYGICRNLKELLDNEIITYRQWSLFDLYKWRPPSLRRSYWWEAGLKKPRQKFLKELIEKLEGEIWK